jgi:hypothetical protein
MRILLTFHLLLRALEREAVESLEPALRRDESFIRKTLGDERVNRVTKQYGKHADAARNLFSYMNIADVLRLAVAAGTIQMSGDLLQQVRRARNASAHPSLALVTSHGDVSTLANVKDENLRLLGTLQARTTTTTLALRSAASSAGR